MSEKGLNRANRVIRATVPSAEQPAASLPSKRERKKKERVTLPPEAGRAQKRRVTLENGKARIEVFDEEIGAYVQDPTTRKAEDSTPLPPVRHIERTIIDADRNRAKAAWQREALLARARGKQEVGSKYVPPPVPDLSPPIPRDAEWQEEMEKTTFAQQEADLRSTFQKPFVPFSVRLSKEERELNERFRALPSGWAPESHDIPAKKNIITRLVEWLRGTKSESAETKLERRTDNSDRSPAIHPMARAMAESIEQNRAALKREAIHAGVADYLAHASKWYQDRFSFKQRIAISALLISGGIVSTVAAPAALGIVGAAAFGWRSLSAAAAGGIAGTALGSFLRDRDVSEKAVKQASNWVAGLTFATVFVGGSMAGEYVEPWLRSYLDSAAPVPDASMSSMQGDVARFAPPHVVDIPVAEPSAPPQIPILNPTPAPDILPISDAAAAEAPSVPDAAPSEAAEPEGSGTTEAFAEPVVIKGNVSVWSALLNGLGEHGINLSEGGRQAFAQAVHAAIEDTGTQGAFIEHGGTGLSGVAWDKLPDGAHVHFDLLFKNEAFIERLDELLSSPRYKTLGSEIVRAEGDISSFLEKTAAAYGAR